MFFKVWTRRYHRDLGDSAERTLARSMWWSDRHLQVCHGRGDDNDDVQYHGDDDDNVGVGWAPTFKIHGWDKALWNIIGHLGFVDVSDNILHMRRFYLAGKICDSTCSTKAKELSSKMFQGCRTRTRGSWWHWSWNRGENPTQPFFYLVLSYFQNLSLN